MNFIEQVTYDLISRGWDNLRNMTIVFPMHRAALFMKEEFKRQMLRQHLDKPVLAPRFTTLSELTDELCAPYLRPDDEIHSVCLLHEIFCEQTHAEIGLDTFYGWGMQLLTDLWQTGDARKVTEGVLAATDLIWHEHGDLNAIPGLTDLLTKSIQSILDRGMMESVKEVIIQH